MSRLGAILVALLFLCTYLAGYWPQHQQFLRTQAQLNSATSQLNTAETKLRIYQLCDKLFLLIEALDKKNFADARNLSSSFFDAVRSEAGLTENPQKQSALRSILGRRDSLTASLATATPGTVESLRQIFAELRQLVDAAELPAS